MKYHIFLFSFLFFSGQVIGAQKLTRHQNSHFIIKHDFATMSAQEHFDVGMKAFENKSYGEALRNFRIVKINFPSQAVALESLYYIGVCKYILGDLGVANEAFSDYLKEFATPKFFQEAIEYKFSIAERLKNGEKTHLFGAKITPKWFSGKVLAIEIYDEVIAALPSYEYAAQSLFAKGVLLGELKEYRESVETFQTLIKHFPRHELVPEAYLTISKVFLDQSHYEFQNPDLITFAEINMRKFTLEYPRDGRVDEMKNDVEQIKEIYAQGLYDTGQYYERLEKWNASLVCYRNAIEKFPGTQVAKNCEERMATLDSKLRRMADDLRDPRFRTNRIKNVSPGKTV